ncbi:MAG: hypothetical protein FJY67_09860, partial [Calditrichaeota bacterium]|nr:hypothetical protein [Calditrichota bacterium]
MPSWTVEMTIPFSERIYRMGELLTDSTRLAERGWGIITNPVDSTLMFESRDSIDYQPVGDRLTYEASSIGNYVNRIDTIRVEEPTPDLDTINIAEANPALQPGYNGPVSAFDMEQARDTMTFDIFRWVRVYRGYLVLTVENRYPVEMQNLTVRISNLVSQDAIGTAVFPPFQPGEVRSDSIDLSGKYLENQLLMIADGHSPGSFGSNVQIVGDEKLSITVSITPTDVESCEAEVAEQQFDNDDHLDFDNKNKVIVADIKRGSAYFQLRNTTRLKLTSRMVFENLFDSTGTPIVRNVVMEPEASSDLTTIDLDGARLEMTLDDQRLRVRNEVIVEDTRVTRFQGESYQLISGDQGVDVTYWTDELTFRSFEGVLDSVTVDIPGMLTAIDMPQGLDSINFTRDTLYIRLLNDTEMPLRLHLDIMSSNSEFGRLYSIAIDEDINPGLTEIVIPNSDRLATVIPDTISIAGWGGLGKYYFPHLERTPGRINDDQGFSGQTIIRSALKFTIGTTRVVTDLTRLSEPVDQPIESA